VACEIDREGLSLLSPSPRVVEAESSEVVDRWLGDE
jgi:hypothetical protein